MYFITVRNSGRLQSEASAKRAIVCHQTGWDVIIGIPFCTLNIVLLLLDCILISPRFYRRPGSFTYSFTDQVESLFILAFARQRTVKLHIPLTSAILA